VIYDNEFIWGWLRDRENDGNTSDVRIFRQVQTSWRIIALRRAFFIFLREIDVVVVLWGGGGCPALLFSPRGQGLQGKSSS
jgi:hypothetical protein